MTDDFIAPGDLERPARVIEVIQERVSFGGLRVLDLACRTGAFCRALAEAGAHEVLGVEGRPDNLNRAPATERVRYELGDVRDLSVARHGKHHVTLCLGILYHLDAVDAVGLLRAMREVTTGFAIVDTHIGVPRDRTAVDGNMYDGNWYGEPPGLWSSIGNDASFWFTADSLAAAARHAGWSTVEVVEGPVWPASPAGRLWLVLS